MKLKCECCGIEQEFPDDNGETAFNEGWDAPPHFTQVMTCGLCPSAPFVIHGDWHEHDSIHEKWEREGRPAEFSVAECVAPEHQTITDEQIAEMQALTAGVKDPMEILRLFQEKRKEWDHE
jgi:hypothetical protein